MSEKTYLKTISKRLKNKKNEKPANWPPSQCEHLVLLLFSFFLVFPTCSIRLLLLDYLGWWSRYVCVKAELRVLCLVNVCHLWITVGIIIIVYDQMEVDVLSPSFPRYTLWQCYIQTQWDYCRHDSKWRYVSVFVPKPVFSFPSLNKRVLFFSSPSCSCSSSTFFYGRREGRRRAAPNSSDDDGSGRWSASGCHVDRLASALLHAPIRRYDDAGLLGNARSW